MTRLLHNLERAFETRMMLRRRMLASLGFSLGPDEAPAHRDDIRETLLRCADCSKTSACCGWLDQGHPGVPHFCRARDAFHRLQSADLRRARRREPVR